MDFIPVSSTSVHLPSFLLFPFQAATCVAIMQPETIGMPATLTLVLVQLSALDTLGGHFASVMLIPFNCPSSSLDTWWPFCFGGLMLWLVGSACWLALVGRAPPASNELPPISSSSRLLPLLAFLPFISFQTHILLSFLSLSAASFPRSHFIPL